MLVPDYDDDRYDRLVRCEDCGWHFNYAQAIEFLDDDEVYYLCPDCDFLRQLTDSQRGKDGNDLQIQE